MKEERFTTSGGYVGINPPDPGNTRGVRLQVCQDFSAGNGVELSQAETVDLARNMLRHVLEPGDWNQVRGAIECTRYQTLADRDFIEELRWERRAQ